MSADLWHAEVFRQLPDDQKLLYLYFYFGPNMNFTGCCVLPTGYALHDLKWIELKYEAARKGLVDAGLIMVDCGSSELFIVDFERRWPLSTKQQDGIFTATSQIRSEKLRAEVINNTKSRPLAKKKGYPQSI